jgi:hypothetical protein
LPTADELEQLVAELEAVAGRVDSIRMRVGRALDEWDDSGPRPSFEMIAMLNHVLERLHGTGEDLSDAERWMEEHIASLARIRGDGKV